MFSLNSRFRSAFLAVVVLVSCQISTISAFDSGSSAVVKPSYMARVASLVPFTRKQAIGIVFFAIWSRLTSKGSKFDYEDSTLRQDLKETLESLSLADLVALIDKWIVGRKVSIVDVCYVKETSNGPTKIKDKLLLTKPFGLAGNFHAYVLSVMDPLAKIVDNMVKINKLSNGQFDIELCE